MTELRIERVHGAEITPYLPELARLRIEVFREYPYLYEGSADDEARYLASYADTTSAIVVVALDGTRVVGASTAMPLSQHGEAVAPPLVQAGFEASRVYYFGESVLLPDYRGRGIGHRFFDAREAMARSLGMSVATFCAVERPDDHPARPRDYVPHDAFWTKRGYTRRDDIVASFAWRDLGHSEETRKPMVFWLKELAP